MIEYLRSKNIEIKGHGPEYQIKCLFCDDDKFHLYFNESKQIFHCHKCSTAGNIWKLKKHFGDIIEPKKTNKQIFKKPKEGKDDILYKDLLNSDTGMKFLTVERGFSQESIKYFKLGFYKGYAAFPYYRDRKLVNFKYRNIAKKDFRREKDCESTIFNCDNIDRTKNIIVTEGEADCIAGWQMGFKNIVSVSVGAGSLNDCWFEFFENCSGDVYIAYDNDEKGEEGAKKLAKRIGLARCYRLKLPLKDFNECLMAGYSKSDIDSLIEKSESYKPSRVKTLPEVLVDYEKMFLHRDKGKGIKLNNGWDGFNKFIGGFRPSELTTLTGDTSSGKTTFSLNIAYDLIFQHKPVIILSSEMPVVKILSKMFSIHTATNADDFDSTELAACMADFIDKPLYFIDVHGALDVEEVSECLEYSKSKYGIELVIIDHLHYLLDRKIDNQVQAIELFMIDMVKNAKKLELHIILIAHPSKLNNSIGFVTANDIKGSSSVKQDSDNIITVWRDKENEPDPDNEFSTGRYEVLIKLEKVRDISGKEGSKTFLFDPSSQRYTELKR